MMILQAAVSLIMLELARQDLKYRSVPQWEGILAILLAGTACALNQSLLLAICSVFGAAILLWLTGKVGFADRAILPLMAGTFSLYGVFLVALSLILAFCWNRRKREAAPLLYLFAACSLPFTVLHGIMSTLP